MKTSRSTSISQLKQIIPMDGASNRKTKSQSKILLFLASFCQFRILDHPRTTSVSKKRYSSSQSLDSSVQNGKFVLGKQDIE